MATNQLLEQKDIGTFYAGIPQRETVYRRHKPKVTLFFLEDSTFKPGQPKSPIAQGKDRTSGFVSFRLMDETTQSFSEGNGKALGEKIKQTFGTNNGFVWNKGKTLYSYTEWEKGYQLQLLCKSESEAKRIVAATLSIQGHSPDWLSFQTVKNDQEPLKYPSNPGSHIVMGKTEEIPTQRPVVDVRFQYAYVKLSGVKEPKVLYDRRGKRVGALVR